MQKPVPDAKTQGRNRKIFLILVLVFAVPYLAALVVYKMQDTVEVGQQTNYGQLVQPLRPLGEFDFERLDNDPANTGKLTGKWLLITVAASRCDEPCIANLYKLRQIRRALAEDRRRVDRLLVLLENEQLDALRSVLKEYEGMEVMTGPNDAVARTTALLNTENALAESVKNRIFIVDPLGNLMMEYPADADPVGILKDLQRLLKLSKIG